MKLKILIAYSIALLLVTIGCSRKTIPTSAEVNYLTGKDGTITMRAIGVSSNQEDAIFDAIKNTFEVIFFRGLPESEQKTALIGTNEVEEKAKHKNYFDKFYNEQRYKSFVMSSIPTTSLIKSKSGKKSIAVDIKINLTALRNDLVQNNIIKEFGF